ncbi:uncharacterized protein [Diabrotica undecimpunctata]|uniref:uncharacterized protein n=1 Tax=Diabrotica undecimpunctata TaxID=50387 RepID=UPI003B635A3B
MEPYLDKGHHLFLDNFYNSILLSKSLSERKTHSTGTLRRNRKENPKALVNTNLKKGEHKWRRDGSIYISMWKDKREVLCITTKYHPKLINVQNRFGETVIEPEEVARYNEYMSEINRSDQMTIEKTTRSESNIARPKCIVDCNTGKSSIDLSDQMAPYSTAMRRCTKWFRKLLFEIIWGSALFLYNNNELKMQKSLKINECREPVIRSMLQKYATDVPQPPNPRKPGHKLIQKMIGDPP